MYRFRGTSSQLYQNNRDDHEGGWDVPINYSYLNNPTYNENQEFDVQSQFCIACGVKQPVNSKFCVNCGTNQDIS